MFEFLWDLTKKMHPRITFQQTKIFWSLGIGFLIGFLIVSLYTKYNS